jgi:hypothetical protein
MCVVPKKFSLVAISIESLLNVDLTLLRQAVFTSMSRKPTSSSTSRTMMN